MDVAGVTTAVTVDINGDIDVDGHTNLDNVSVSGISTFSGILDATNTPASIRVAQEIQHKGDADTALSFGTDIISLKTAGTERLRIQADGDVSFGDETTGRAQIKYLSGDQANRNAGGFPQYAFVGNEGTGMRRVSSNVLAFDTTGEERIRIDSNGNISVSNGRLLLGTINEGAADADDLTIATSGNTGITIRSGTTHNGSIYFSDTTSGIGEYVGQIDYDHNNNSMNFYADNDQCLRLLNDKSVSVSDKLVLENGTVFLNKHSVGIGTTTQAGRNAGLGTAIGTVIFNTEDQGSLQVYHGDSIGWVGASNNFSASGGTETTDRSGFKVHEFTSPGTFTVSSGSKNVELMVIGGGGAGGGNPGSGANGGGGAGALYFNNALPVSTGSYTVTVGGGGPGAKNKGDTGSASAFGPAFPAAGGGGGGMRGDSDGLPGGSGGGGGQGPPGSGNGGTASGAAGGSASQSSP